MGRTACTEPQCLYRGDLYFTFLLGYVGARGGLVGRSQMSRHIPAFEPRTFGPKTVYMADDFPFSYLNRRPFSCLCLQAQSHFFGAPIEIAVRQNVFI